MPNIVVLSNGDIFCPSKIIGIQGPYKSGFSEDQILIINGNIDSRFSTLEKANDAKHVLTAAMDSC